MFSIYYELPGERRQIHRVEGTRCRVGSSAGNDLVLRAHAVARQQLQLEQQHDGVYATTYSGNKGTWLNRRNIRRSGPLGETDLMVLGEVKLWVVQHNETHAVTASSGGAPSLHTTSPSIQGQRKIDTPPDTATAQGLSLADDPTRLEWERQVHTQLIEKMDLRRRDVHRMDDRQLRTEALELIDEILAELQQDIADAALVKKIRGNVLDEAVGLGPLEAFLQDDDISEIMVNGYRHIFVERSGVLSRAPSTFSSDAAVSAVIDRIITPLGRRLDESCPIVDARLKDGSRVNAIIPPLAVNGPALTIRKFSRRHFELNDLVTSGALSSSMADFLQTSVRSRRNIVVSGGTGSGKTTLLNMLSGFIADDQRIVTIEDAAELKLSQPNLVTLEARTPNIDGAGEITIRQLVRNSLRMRPDRIVVGECRGGEAVDMLQAMNTGHEGSMTTVHANSPRDALSRLEVLVLMAGLDLPITAIREQLASAVDIVIQMTRFPDGARRMTRISEVVGLESGTLQVQDLFAYQESASLRGHESGKFCATGAVPTFYEHLHKVGTPVDLAVFQPEESKPA